jgi:hypothetical protein
MAYPTPNVHRRGRRSLGRHQSASVDSSNSVAVTPTVSTTTLTLTFNKPVVVTGIIPVTVTGGETLVSQTIVSSTVVTQIWSATLASATVTIPANAANVASYQGGGTEGITVTF